MKKISLAFVAALGLMAFSTQPGRLIQTSDNNIRGILGDTTILPSQQQSGTTSPGMGTDRTDSGGTQGTRRSAPLNNTTPGTSNTLPGTNTPNSQYPNTNQPGSQTAPLGNGSPTGAGQPGTGTGTTGTGSAPGSTGTTR